MHDWFQCAWGLGYDGNLRNFDLSASLAGLVVSFADIMSSLDLAPSTFTRA